MTGFMMQLRDMHISPADYAMRGWLSNWTYLSMKLQEHPHLSSEDYVKLIKLELDGKKRKDMVHRLKNKFNTVRRNEEWRELIEEFNL